MLDRWGRIVTRTARAVAVACVAVLLLVGIARTARAQDAAEAAAQPMIGQAAPGFDLKTVAGESLSLDGLRGRYLVVHFGASW